MEFLPERIKKYAEAHTTRESHVLADLEHATWSKIFQPRMLSGHLQGRILAMFSQMIKPKYILEIGAYTGYSTLCLVEGLREGGKLHTIDINEELEDMIRNYIERAKLTDKIELHIGNAMEVIPQLNYSWDIVFIDADKENYSNYFDLIIDQMSSNSYIIADNALWSGKVTEKPDDKDEETKALIAYNEKVHNNNGVENVLLPIRDGLMVCRKL